MSYREEIEITFSGFREAGHAAAGAKAIEHSEPAGQEFMGVALVADVKEQPIVSEIEDVVHRDGQFDHAQIRREVSAALPDLVADRPTDLGGQLWETADGDSLEILRGSDSCKQVEVHSMIQCKKGGTGAAGGSMHGSPSNPEFEQRHCSRGNGRFGEFRGVSRWSSVSLSATRETPRVLGAGRPRSRWNSAHFVRLPQGG